jgi:DNA-directed RNA polymerase subunit RPC12/RpoP
VNESSWQIEHDCPQCGAPVVLEETDRLLACNHCRVRLYLTTEQHFSYLLPPPDGVSGEIFFAPYWRFKGMVFSCQGNEVSNKVADTSYLASELRCLPISLGFRPQALKLRFVSAQMPGRFLKTAVPLQQVIATVQNCVHATDLPNVPPPRCFHAFLGETVSAIYAPYFLQGSILHDAILQRPVCTLAENGLKALQAPSSPPEDRLRFIATLCPHCGWDLKGDKDSLVLMCGNCDSAWQASAATLERVPFGTFPGGGADTIYLPFWRIKVPLEGIPLRSYADLIRMANLPKAIQREWEEIVFHFWSPAFKIRPRAFLQTARAMTLTQPQEIQEGLLPKGNVYPVTFSVREALEAVKVILAHIAVAKQHLIPLLPQLRIGPPEILLSYFAFTVRPNELIQERLRLSIDRSTVQMGRKL